MSSTTEKLEELNKLQELQNHQSFADRFQMLEEQVKRLSILVENMKTTLSQLQMDFSKEQVDLSTSLKKYTSK